ncbi:MAG TPA: ABC transporter substrate-binding protein [Methylomirabilota bacterium]|jgi:putative tryptophan/tyrosine transport system substrate-binding protein|nr:ABC transporter substrate-binding protein [Methylomirabilota bacterium]
MTRRRAVLGGIAATLVAARVGRAQRAERMVRVSIYAREPTWRDAITGVLRERGWVEGRTITFIAHSAEGDEDHIAEHLAAAPPDAMVLGGPIRVRAAMRATATIPIIGLDLESDPVASGFVKTLARPGGNVSGVWMDLPEIAGKQIQFLREVVPSLNRLGVLRDDRIGRPQFDEVQAVCRRTGTSVHAVPVRAEAEIDGAVRRLAAERPQAVLVLTAPVISVGLSRIGELLLAERLPSISPFSTFPRVGGLLAYGPDFPTMWRQVAQYVDRVLKGGRVGDLPVERPSKFSLIVSRPTARRIGLELPSSLVLRADEVIS